MTPIISCDDVRQWFKNADVVITLSLLQIALEREGILIDIDEAVIDKFNKTSDKHGMKTKL